MNIDHYTASDKSCAVSRDNNEVCDLTGFHLNCDIWELGRSENEARIIYTLENILTKNIGI